MRPSKGLSIVELMITISLGLLLTAALIAVFSNTIGVNSRSMKLSQLNEEATAVMELMLAELRRAGYRGDAAELIYDPVNASNDFNKTIRVSRLTGEKANSCILFSYDKDADGQHDDAAENFGFRLNAKQIQRRQASAGCASSGWQSITSDSIMLVNKLEFNLIEQILGRLHAQRVSVVLEVRMPTNSEIIRTFTNEVVIRNAF
tara:strand:+ start:2149 stop:2760 length:612 start_codon:yes stop_codon:yes gene_type:complete